MSNYIRYSNSKDIISSFDGLEIERQPTVSESILTSTSMLLKKCRAIVRIVRGSSNVLQFVRHKAEAEAISAELIKDFKIRWNFTLLFLLRFNSHKLIVNEITGNPAVIPGITTAQQKCLKKLDITDDEWVLIRSLIEILTPFSDATRMLSGTTYQTLSIKHFIATSLKSFHELNTSPEDLDDYNDDDSENTGELFATNCNLLKSLLLKSFEKYTKKHISDEQTKAALVSFFELSFLFVPRLTVYSLAN